MTIPSLTVCSHRSPGLTALYNAIKSEKNHHILDFGSGSGTTLNFYLKLGCRFQFLGADDLVETLSVVSMTEFSRIIDSLFADLDGDRKFDLIIFWDFLNYFSLAKRIYIFESLCRYIKPDALLHVVSYMGRRQPVRPAHFKVCDQYQVLIERDERMHDVYDQPTSAAMIKALPKFYMLHNYLSVAGMVAGVAEQVFCYRPQSSAKTKAAFSTAEISDASSAVKQTIYSPSLALARAMPRNRAVLDLGCKAINNQDLWKRYFDNVFSENLSSAIQRWRSKNELSRQQFLREGVFLDFPERQMFDVIVLWDFANFMDQELLVEVGWRLTRHCHNGTLLVLMSYSQKIKPDSPQPFVLLGDGMGLAAPFNRGDSGESVGGGQPVTSLRIQKAFPSFYLQETFSSRPGMLHGLSEYVFAFKDERAQRDDTLRLKAQVQARREKRHVSDV